MSRDQMSKKWRVGGGRIRSITADMDFEEIDGFKYFDSGEVKRRMDAIESLPEIAPPDHGIKCQIAKLFVISDFTMCAWAKHPNFPRTKGLTRSKGNGKIAEYFSFKEVADWKKKYLIPKVMGRKPNPKKKAESKYGEFKTNQPIEFKPPKLGDKLFNPFLHMQRQHINRGPVSDRVRTVIKVVPSWMQE